MKRAFKEAFPHTIPVMTGYLLLGAVFGILMAKYGLSFLWSGLMSLVIYAGSMQYAAMGLFQEAFSPLNIALMTLMVNARHIFYGFSMLEKYHDTEPFKPYLVFSLTDETFSLIHTLPVPAGIPKGQYYFAISLLNHLYWITGSVAGGLLGAGISIDLKGMDFVMTAFFVAIAAEQFKKPSNRLPILIGIAVTALCLLVFGRQSFLIAAMVLLCICLLALQKPLERQETA